MEWNHTGYWLSNLWLGHRDILHCNSKYIFMCTFYDMDGRLINILKCRECETHLGRPVNWWLYFPFLGFWYMGDSVTKLSMYPLIPNSKPSLSSIYTTILYYSKAPFILLYSITLYFAVLCTVLFPQPFFSAWIVKK